MTVCEHGHDQIEFEGDECPLCEVLHELEEVRQILNGYVDALDCKRRRDE